MEQWKTFRKTSHATWEVSNFGNIRKNGKDYQPYEKGGHEGNRYLTLSLNKPFGGYVHRIVANYFLPNPDNKPTINHKDGDKSNNHVDNLEWEDYARQLTHAYETGLNTNFCVSWDRVTPYKEYLEKRRDAVVRMRLEGKKLVDIGKALGVSTTIVYNDLKARGINKRNKG